MRFRHCRISGENILIVIPGHRMSQSPTQSRKQAGGDFDVVAARPIPQPALGRLSVKRAEPIDHDEKRGMSPTETTYMLANGNMKARRSYFDSDIPIPQCSRFRKRIVLALT